MVDDLLPGGDLRRAPAAHRRARARATRCTRRRSSGRSSTRACFGRPKPRGGRSPGASRRSSFRARSRGSSRRDSTRSRRREVDPSGRRRGRAGSSGRARSRASPAAISRRSRETLGRLRVKELVVPQEPSSFSGEAEFAFRHNLIRDGAYDSLPEVAPRRETRGSGSLGGRARRRPSRRDRRAGRDPLRRGAPLPGRTRRDRSAHTPVSNWTATDGRGRRAIERARSGSSRRRSAGIERRSGWRNRPASRSRAGRGRAGPRARVLGDRADRWSWRRRAGRRSSCSRRSGTSRVRAGPKRGWRGPCSRPAGTRRSSSIRSVGSSGWKRSATTRSWPTHCTRPRLVLLAPRQARRCRTAASAQHAGRRASRCGRSIARRRCTPSRSSCSTGDGSRRGLSMLLESFRLAKETGNFGLLLRAYNNVPASISEYASDYARAEEIVREGIEISSRAGARQNLGWLLGTLGDALFDMGRLPEAEVVQLEALEHATAVRDGPLTGMRSIYLGRIRLLRGDLDEAVALLATAEDLFHENPEPQTEALLELFGGQLAEARGDDATALDRYERVRKIGERSRRSVGRPGVVRAHAVAAANGAGGRRRGRRGSSSRARCRRPPSRSRARCGDWPTEDPAEAVVAAPRRGGPVRSAGQEGRARSNPARSGTRATADRARIHGRRSSARASCSSSVTRGGTSPRPMSCSRTLP